MKSDTVGWAFYMFLINFSQQNELGWPIHVSFDLWGTALKSSLPSCETSSFNEIKHLSSIRNPSQWGCPFNIILSNDPSQCGCPFNITCLMTDANCCCLLYTYVSHSCHSLKSAAQPRDILVAMETISVHHPSFDKGSPRGEDKTMLSSCRCTPRRPCGWTDQLYSCRASPGDASTSAGNKTLLLKYAASARAFLFPK